MGWKGCKTGFTGWGWQKAGFHNHGVSCKWWNLAAVPSNLQGKDIKVPSIKTCTMLGWGNECWNTIRVLWNGHPLVKSMADAKVCWWHPHTLLQASKNKTWSPSQSAHTVADRCLVCSSLTGISWLDAGSSPNNCAWLRSWRLYWHLSALRCWNSVPI